jgi:hypothetical protein
MGSEFIIKNGYFSQGNSTITGSLIVTQGITGSFQGSSSYALTASYIQNAQSASYINPLIQDVEITGSLNVTGSQIYLQTNNFVVENIDLNGSLIEANLGSGVVIWDSLTGSSSADFNNRYLYDSTGATISVDWNNRQLFTSNGITTWPSLDWAYGYAYNSNLVNTINWESGLLNDNASQTSIDWEQRYLKDTTAVSSIDWNNRQLIKSDGTTVGFDWENGQIIGSLTVTGSQVWIYTDNYATYINGIDLLAIDTNGARFNDLSGNSSVSAENRTLYNNSGQPSVDWNNRQLYDSSGATVVVDWNQNILSDNTAGAASIDWEQRQLIKSDGSTIAFDWENGILTGSLYGTSSWSENSISSSYALTASYVAGASSFPYTGSAQITGSLGVTGSVVATSFSGDGSGLTGITATNVSSKLFNYYNFI